MGPGSYIKRTLTPLTKQIKGETNVDLLKIYLDGEYWKSVVPERLFEAEYQLGPAIRQLSFQTNRRVYITLTDDYVASDFIRKVG